MAEPVRDSGVRERTRRAIVLSAISTLTRTPTASLGDVAEAAGVARSTLHRYFADRGALRAAIDEFVQEEYVTALRRSRPEEGTGLDAFGRFVAELLDGHDVFTWWMTAETADADADEDEVDAAVAGVVARGHRDGSIDAGLAPTWLVHMVWAGLYAAYHYPESEKATRREVRDQCLRSLLKVASS